MLLKGNSFANKDMHWLAKSAYSNALVPIQKSLSRVASLSCAVCQKFKKGTPSTLE